MVLVAAAPAAQLVVTVSPLVLGVIGIGFLLWIALLTAVVWRRCREPWRDDGRPVFRRLPDGRVRFSWGVAAQLAAAQRQGVVERDHPDSWSAEHRVVPDGVIRHVPIMSSISATAGEARR